MKRGYFILIIIIIIVLGIWLFKNSETATNDKSEKEVSLGDLENETKYSSDAVLCALNLYKKAKDSGMEFVSQCLGICGDYAVDIVHVPRNDIDNLIENQCNEYRNRKVSRFIELYQEGNIFRIV